MLDLEKIPEPIIENLRHRGHSDEDIRNMTPVRAFDEHCSWQGLLGYGRQLFRDVKYLEAAEVSA